MTEDPIGAAQRPTAGEVGLHRQEPGTATPESAGPSLNVPEVHAPPKPYVKPVVSHGRGDPLAGLSEPPERAAAEQGRTPEEPGRTPGGLHQAATGPGHDSPNGDRGGTRVSEADRLRDDIVHTREELGRTVEALAHKVDVKSRAQQKMADTKAVARRKVAGTKAAAKEKAAEMADRLRGVTSHTRAGAPPASTDSEMDTGLGLGPVTAREPVPERLRSMAEEMSAQARRHPGAIIAAGAATVAGAGLLALVQRRTRPSTSHEAWHAARRARDRMMSRHG
ncbi:DUF3618 domain-containing protein [Sphaerisporangium dianthi]|uniref:DUF3618 domain-containing protein n=1 Tax=Sphaerisporangium dianthi TaxID=1436120 RepID=A0ABV9CJM3_9ACTN